MHKVKMVAAGGDPVTLMVDDDGLQDLKRSIGRQDLPEQTLDIVSDGDELPAGDPDDSWKLGELKAWATDRKIPLGGAKTKAEILAVLPIGRAGGVPLQQGVANYDLDGQQGLSELAQSNVGD